MKKLFTLIILTVFAFSANAQLEAPITFLEAFSDTSWNLFENGANGLPEDFMTVLNPYQSDPNLSDSVLQLVVNDDAQPWVGMYSDYVGVMEFTEAAHTMSFMVYKTITSPMRIKLEQSLNEGADYSVTVENTLTDEWEEVVFVLPEAVGYYYTRLTIFPDFPAERLGGSTLYLDNIANAVNTTSTYQFTDEKVNIFPNPVDNRMSVQYPEMTGLKISNVLGKELRTIDFQTASSKIVELGDLQSGIYFVTVETRNGNFSTTFMKK